MENRELQYQTAKKFMSQGSYSLEAEAPGRLNASQQLDAAWDVMVEAGIDPEQETELLLELAESVSANITDASQIASSRYELVERLNKLLAAPVDPQG